VKIPPAAVVLIALVANSVATGTIPSQSLKGKTDEELLNLVCRGRNDTQKKQATDFPFSIDQAAMDRLWEMLPRDAALAFASEYVQKEAKGRVKFTIEIDPSQKPPPSGEIGIRWISGNYYAMPEHGAIVLYYDRPRSRLSISDFQILSRPSERELEEALNQTDEHDVPVPVAQQAYEILWWLNHVHPVGYRVGGSSFSSVDDLCDAFWMNPGGPYFSRTFLGIPNAEDLNNEEFSSFPAFAETLLRQIIEKQGIKRKDPLPTVGHFVDINADAAFLRLHATPASEDSAVVKRWVDQMLSILRKPERYKMYLDVLYDLVPTEDPLKYKDPDIDRALLDLIHRSESAAAVHDKAAHDAEAQQKKILNEIEQGKPDIDQSKRRALSKEHIDESSAARSIRGDAQIAAEMLGYRDQLKIFPELMKRAEQFQPGEFEFDQSNSLIGAAALAGNHPNLRPQLIQYLRTQLTNIRLSHFSPRQLFECAWRADLRELAPDLQKLATESPAENEQSLVYAKPGSDVNCKFHAARAILTAWRETDRLTKIKLDALISGDIPRGGPIPNFMRAEFDALSANERLTFRSFITWLRKVDAPFSKENLEDVFTPHTPRKKEDMGLRQYLYD
jgi:hypothetical protein